jgi:DNA (cytosine-5)-methyltransferase 1
MSFRNDPYHQPQRELRLQKPALDPHVNLAKCITTSGGDNVHYSGTRKNTVRELSLLQGFPQDFHFTGSNTQAKMQCGNAWAPSASKVYFAVWAAHREAFDNGFIEDEDEVLDLYQFLEDKGDFIPGPPVIDLDHPQTHRDNSPKYRYLHRIEKNVRPNFPLPLWGKHKSMEPAPQVKRRMARTSNLLNGSLDNSDNAARSGRRRNITGRKRRRTAVWIDDDEEPTWISEEE